jgi:hypothetical protein
MNNIVIFKQSYGEFTTEKDGRLSGTVLTIKGKRKDGNTTEQLQFEVFKMERKELEQTV